MRRQAKLPTFGTTGSGTPGARPHATRRILDAVGYGQDFTEDWEERAFSSSRVDRARYSEERRELQVFWTNAPPGVPYPPYVYAGVDPATWTNFTLSGSPGRYVNTNLNHFPYNKAPHLIGEF
jgi:hypothetical protein